MTFKVDGSNGLTFNDATAQATSAIVGGKLPFVNLPSGSVLQIVTSYYSTSTSSTSATYANTGLTATITPKYSTSKILILANQNGCGKVSASTYLNLKLIRSSDSSVLQTVEGICSTGSTANMRGVGIPMMYLDSPATTSAISYYTQFNNQNATGTCYVQDFATTQTYSIITLMEIAA
jgi:hypothetical protein